MKAPVQPRTQKQTRKKITLRDVAQESRVSIATVSLVLNNSPHAQNLAAETRERVEDVARRLNYAPDLMARSLKNRQSQTVGVMIFEIADPYCMRLLKGIESAFESTDLLPLIMSVRNKSELLGRYSRLVQERRIEGLILVPNWATIDRSSIPNLALTPSVIIGWRPSDNISSVLVDNVAGGFRALEYVHSLGHRNIAFLRGPRHIPDSVERWKGIRSFAKKANLKIDPERVLEIQTLPCAHSSFSEGYRLTKVLMGQKRSFTALVAFDDLAAAGAIQAFHEAGWDIPRKCSVIGFDDIPLAQFISPALTTVRQPLEEMGRHAVEILLAEIQQKEHESAPCAHKMLDPILMVRASTSPPHRTELER